MSPRARATDCGPCGSTAPRTPREIVNPPGRTALDVRIGTHPSFLEEMLRDVGREPSLTRLTTRGRDDATVAVLDAVAAMLDILTFYQERIANEGYLGTATTRRSVLELARTIGYELNPGVAAGTWLAFTLETAEGSPEKVRLEQGIRAQSVPGQDERPQIFETTSSVEARPEWNALPALDTVPRLPERGDTEVVLKGTATNLRPGDRVVLVGKERERWWGSERWDARKVVGVRPVEADPLGLGPPAHTVVELDRPLGSEMPVVDPARKDPKLHVLETRAALFGHNAIAWSDLPLSLRVGEAHPTTGAFITGPYASRASSWANASFPAGTNQIWLDQVHEGVTPGGWLLLANSGYEELYRVVEVTEEVHSDFLLSGPTSRLQIAGENIFFFSPKDAVVWAGSRALDLADPPRTEPITGESVPLKVKVEGIEPGRAVAVTGIDADTGESTAEVRIVREVRDEPSGSVLLLEKDLEKRYLPSTVRVNANVAPATHGESWSEVLGDGDTRRSWLQFPLSNSPLTYVSAATPSGGTSTLVVRVGGVAWDQVSQFYGQPADALAYVVPHQDNGRAVVEFGPDARPPTGTGNISATYRVGLGKEGNLPAERLTIPLSRPLGLRSLTNPVPATGGADAEVLDDARLNAPLTVRALDRIVSIDDHESFALAFAGIAKARADALWSGERRYVHLTVAADDGVPMGSDHKTLVNLRTAIDRARHVGQPILISDHERIPFRVEAAVKVDGRRIVEDVLASAIEALLNAFSFARRGYAQTVRRSEVLALLHSVPGVLGVVLKALHPVPGSGTGDVAARPARWEAGAVRPAQIATLDASDIDLREWVP